jgi:integrase/transposase InsO family protein
MGEPGQPRAYSAGSDLQAALIISTKFTDPALKVFDDHGLETPLDDLLKYCAHKISTATKTKVSDDIARLAPWAEAFFTNLDYSSLPKFSLNSSEAMLQCFKRWTGDGRGKRVKFRKQDLVQNRYVISDPNAIWACDTTERSDIRLTVIMDMASRKVMGTLLQTSPLTTEAMVMFVKKTISEERVKPTVFHTDLGPVFTSNEFQSFLASEGIKGSVAARHDKKPGNQVLEAFNARLWHILDLNKKNQNEIRQFEAKTAQDRLFLVKCAVIWLNKNQPRTGKPYTDAELYEALIKMPGKMGIITSSDSPDAGIVDDYHKLSIQIKRTKEVLPAIQEKYTEVAVQLERKLSLELPQSYNDLGLLRIIMEQLSQLCTFLIQQAAMQKEHHEAIIANQEEAQRLMEEKFAEAKKDRDFFEQQYKRQCELLETISDQMAARDAKEAEEAAQKEAARQKKLNKVKQPIRAKLSPEQFEKLLNKVEGQTTFIKARDRVALILMFSFGLRVGNIRTLTKKMLSDLLRKHRTDIPLLKDRGTQTFRLIASESHQAWFNAYLPDFKVILDNPDLAAGDPFYNVSRETITRRLNGYFKNLSSEDSVHMRSHSLRATFGSAVMEKVGLKAAKDLLGHASITATMRYDRNNMTPEEQVAAYDVILPPAPTTKKRAGRPSKVKVPVLTEPKLKTEQKARKSKKTAVDTAAQDSGALKASKKEKKVTSKFQANAKFSSPIGEERQQPLKDD